MTLPFPRVIVVSGEGTEQGIGPSGQQAVGVGSLVYLGSQQITMSGSTVYSLTAPSGCTHMFMSLGGTAGDFVRMKFGGVSPTQTVGAKVVVGDYIDLTDPLSDYSSLISGLRLIRDTAAAANVILDVEYFGQNAL